MTPTEKIVTATALFISLLALYVSIQQTKIMSDQKSASVWPYVDIITSYGPGYFRVDIDNDGVGPAKITEMDYLYKDTEFQFIHELVDHILSKNDVDMIFSYSNIEGGTTVLNPGETKQILNLEHDSSEIINVLYKEVQYVDIRLKFCDVYDKCWRIEEGEYQAL